MNTSAKAPALLVANQLICNAVETGVAPWIITGCITIITIIELDVAAAAIEVVVEAPQLREALSTSSSEFLRIRLRRFQVLCARAHSATIGAGTQRRSGRSIRRALFGCCTSWI